MQHRFGFPTPIHFGAGVRKQIPEFLKSKNIRRPLLVVDKGIAELPFCHEMEKDLQAAGFAVGKFGGVWGNPVKSQVEAGAKAYHGHDADAIIGMGGGAALDVAKAVALSASHKGALFDYEGGAAMDCRADNQWNGE
jgi:alcohol dehydrogenase class IV